MGLKKGEPKMNYCKREDQKGHGFVGPDLDGFDLN